jgi:type I restriction enzyme, S subunit
VVATPMAVTTDGAWHGVVPAGWSLKQLKWAVTFQRGHDLPTEDRREGPVPVVTGGGITGWHNVAQARGPGIVTGRYGTIGEFYLVEQDYWPLNTSLYSIDLHGNHAGFLRYMLELLAPLFHLNAAKSAVPGIDRSDIHTIPVAVPPLATQRAIADYLDRETARLDGLVAAKERVLGLLAEKRRAFITRAVTRGLDPRTPLRDSGIPWLGEIPAHWELKRAKWLFSQSALPVRDEDEMVTCFRDGQVTLRKNRREEGFTNAIQELGYQGIRVGQLVLHSMDAFAGAIGVSDSDGKCSPEYIICDPVGAEIINDYFGHLLRIMALNGFIQASCPAVRERAPRIRFPDFGEMFLPVPTRTEQAAIVAHITAEAAGLDALRAATERTVALLKERRAALIAAAVTGKLDVQGAGRHIAVVAD